jgi:dienelactone hydrolase
MMRRTILLLPLVAMLLASCGSDTDEGLDAEPTGRPQGSAAGSPSTGTATGTTTASPSPYVPRTDYEIPPWDELVAMYGYNTAEPLGHKVLAEEHVRGATVYEISYRSSGHAVPAQLVIPDGPGPFPAVVYVSYYNSDISWFGPDSVTMAREGYAGLLVSTPAARPPYACFYWPCWNAHQSIRYATTYVIDIRRGIDLLQTLPEIDNERLGFVGFGDGSCVGGILAGLEDRIDAYAFQSACALFTEIPMEMAWYGEGPPAEEIPAYQDGVAVLNAVNYVGHNRGSAFLLQEASELPSPAQRIQTPALLDALPEPKTVEWFPDEWMGCGAYGSDCNAGLPAFKSHRAWLQRNV